MIFSDVQPPDLIPSLLFEIGVLGNALKPPFGRTFASPELCKASQSVEPAPVTPQILVIRLLARSQPSRKRKSRHRCVDVLSAGEASV
jgi:hypothetical protein